MPRRPIVTLTSDFGLADAYVAAMKAVLLRHCPDATLIDVTHLISRHDIVAGAVALERAVDAFPAKTVHLAVVDPGVGTDRRIIIAKIDDQTVVCPDNGLITWAWKRHRPSGAYEITWRPKSYSATFHGRDVMAPIAARVARGDSLRGFARSMADPVLLDIAPVTSGKRGRIIHIDHFGNATTNIHQSVLAKHPSANIKVKGKNLGKPKRTYGDIAPGKPLALIGSGNLLEIAVREGSAARKLRLNVGDEVILT